jgi:hypothetical protein
MVKVVTTFIFSFASNSKFIKTDKNTIRKFLKTSPTLYLKVIIETDNSRN